MSDATSQSDVTSGDSVRCGGTPFPVGSCSPSLVESAARAAAADTLPSDNTGILESLEFQSICGEDAPCFDSLACAQKILEYCLNPMHVNISSGAFDALNADARSMRNYPIFESKFCQTALQKLLWAGTVASPSAGPPSASSLETIRQTPNGAHEALSAFCGVFGAGEEALTTGVAYSRFLEPARLVREMSRGGWTHQAPEPPKGAVWKLRGVPYGESVDPEAHGETRDVMIVSLDVPTPTPQVVTHVVGGVVAPYAPRARVGFYTTDIGGYARVAPNGLKYTDVFGDVATFNSTNFGAGSAPESTQLVVRASESRSVSVDLTDGDGALTVTQITPEFHGTVAECTINEFGLVVVDLVNVYANAAQLYATDSANCGCFTPFTIVAIPHPEARPTPGYFVSLAIDVDSNNTTPENTKCRYAWNEIPSPTLQPEVYDAAKIGWFGVRIYKNLNGTNTSLPATFGESPFNTRLPNVASPDVFTIDGALELTTPSPKALLQELCACHLPQNVYDDYFAYLSKSGVSGVKNPTLFPGCASSRYPNAARAEMARASPGGPGPGTAQLLPCEPRLNYSPADHRFTSPDGACLLDSFVSPNVPVGDASVLVPAPTTDVATIVAVSGVGLMTVLTLAAIVACVVVKGRALSKPRGLVVHGR